MPSSPSPEAPHLVAKLGGSLLASPLPLRGWLAALRRYPHRLTLVPGGGPFADAVRLAQETLRFSEAAAHHMAIAAMEQYGLALADLEPGLAPAATPREAEAAHRRGAAAIWLPVAMTRAAPQIPQSWDMTSDSLAAWYAHEAGAEALLLIKSVDAEGSASPSPTRGRRWPGEAGSDEGPVVARSLPNEPPGLEAPSSDPASRGHLLPQSGRRTNGQGGGALVDACFAHYARGLAVFIAGPADLGGAAERLRRGAIPGAAFDFTREQSVAT